MTNPSLSLSSTFTPTLPAGLPPLNLTFDLDFTDYLAKGAVMADELDATFDVLKNLLADWPYPTIWYVRIDSQIQALYGSADYFLTHHTQKFEWLQSQGHHLGWHCHPYQKDTDGNWVQTQAEDSILREIQAYAQVAQDYGMRHVRMGWGFHTQQTLVLLDKVGFETDSSAIPRPCYPWAQSQSDWSCTPVTPYHPSTVDFRRPASKNETKMQILEIPMTTALVKAPYDTQSVLRYLNPAYHPEIFQAAFQALQEQQLPIVTLICHPYELLPRSTPHGLLSCEPESFKQNLAFLKMGADGVFIKGF